MHSYMNRRSQLLLVDDERAMTTVLIPFLALSGFDVGVAHDSEEALVQLQRNNYDVIVLDVPYLENCPALTSAPACATSTAAVPT